MRIVAVLILIAALAGGIIWMNQNEASVESMRADMPNVEMGTGSTTITVPTDVDVTRREGEMPDVDVTTEERVIEYPTVSVEDDNDADAMDEEIKPVNEEPHDPVPPANDTLDDDSDGKIDFNDANEATDTDTAEDDVQ